MQLPTQEYSTIYANYSQKLKKRVSEDTNLDDSALMLKEGAAKLAPEMELYE